MQNIKTRLPKILIILSIILLSSCRSLIIPYNEDETPVNTAIPDKPEFAAGIELSNSRIDIFRNRTTETTTDVFGKEEKKTKDRSYHKLGFYLNKYIFFDIHGNLSLVVPGLCNLKDNDNYQLDIIIENLWGHPIKTTVINNSESMIVETYGFLKDIDQYTKQNDSIYFSTTSILNNPIIVMKPNELIYDPQSIFGKLYIDRIQATEKGYKIPNLFNDDEYYQSSPKEILLDDDFDVLWHNDKIEFKYSNYTSYYLYKTDTGFEIFRNKHLISKIEILQNEVILYRFLHIYKKYKYTLFD